MSAAPPAVTVSDRLRVLAPLDPAIDLASVDPGVLERYADLEDLDAENLPLIEGSTPVWFTVAPLSTRQMNTARALSGVGLSDDEEERTLSAVSFIWYLVRFGLRAVEGREWAHKRVKRRGVTMMPEEGLDALTEHETLFLARVIGSISGLPLSRGGGSG